MASDRLDRGIGMTDFRERCIGKSKAGRHLCGDPAPGRGGGDGAVRPRFPLHRLGACADRPRHDREPGARRGRPRRAGDGARARPRARRRSPPRSTAARRACWCRASRPPRRRGRGEGVALSARRASAASGRAAPPATATASSNISPPPTQRSSSRSRSRPPKAWPMSSDRRDRRRRRGLRRTWRSFRVDRRDRAGRRRRSSTQGDRDDHRRDAQARQGRRHLLRASRRMSAAGQPWAPASSSWPATRCSSAPASRPRCRGARPGDGCGREAAQRCDADAIF